MKTFGKLVLIIVGAVVAFFLLIQLIPYGKDHTNPPVVAEPVWDSAQTRELAKRSCFDCHSNEATYPWYSNVAPVSWLVQHDIEEGRSRLNFSDWNASNPRAVRIAREAGETISEGRMPMPIYLLEHPTAKLTDAEKQQLIDGLKASLK
jgi:mono/diheme cytochrome c family protein